MAPRGLLERTLLDELKERPFAPYRLPPARKPRPGDDRAALYSGGLIPALKRMGGAARRGLETMASGSEPGLDPMMQVGRKLYGAGEVLMAPLAAWPTQEGFQTVTGDSKLGQSAAYALANLPMAADPSVGKVPGLLASAAKAAPRVAEGVAGASGLLAREGGKGYLNALEAPGAAIEGTANRLGYTFAPEEGLLAAGVGPRPVDARRVNNSRTPLDAIHPAAISSRLPGVSSPERDAAMRRHLVPGIMAMSRDPEAFAQNVGTLADIPGFGRLRGMEPMKAANMASRQMADNLISIREHMSPEYWNATKVWYPKGAGFVANDHMNRYGLMRQQVAASLANLSPSTLWDLNVEQARRMADMYVNRRGSRMTPTMIDIADTTWDRGAATTPIARGYLEDARRLQSEGKSLDDMLRGGNYKDAALLMQLMDRDVGPKPFPTIYPWGAYGPDYPRQYSPNTVSLMKNAVRTLHEPTREVISDTIAPDKHKIRAFYNDILAPEEVPDEVVVDTHQVGASTLIPYSQTSRPVAANFGDSAAGVRASKLTGSSGTFGVYADAHRRAADMYGETGWNWQSPTWSGIRDVFDKAMKKPQNVAKIEDLWRQVDAGRMSIKEARDEFWKIALEGEKRIPDPDWLKLAPP